MLKVRRGGFIVRTLTDEEVAKRMETQKAFCKEKGWPHFAPPSGVCSSCGKNVYQNYETDGKVTWGWVGDRGLVTGCPHCHRSFCD